MDTNSEKGKIQLHTAGEDYLKTIFMIQKEGKAVRQITLAKSMHLSKPTVSHAVTNLCLGGYLETDEKRYLHLTPEGKRIAEMMYERHCFFAKHLIHIGVDPQRAEQEACQLEHCIGQDTFQKLKKVIDI